MIFLSNNIVIDKLKSKLEIEENELVPTMASNTTTNQSGVECGKATQNSYWYGREAWKAFNGDTETMNINNCWQATSGASSKGEYIQYESVNSDTIFNVKIGTWDDNSNGSDKSWTTYIRGSNDGNNWTKISDNLEISVKQNTLQYFNYNMTNFNTYKYYQVYFDGSTSDTEYVHSSYGYSCSIMFLQFYGLKNDDLLNYYLDKI